MLEGGRDIKFENNILILLVKFSIHSTRLQRKREASWRLINIQYQQSEIF